MNFKSIIYSFIFLVTVTTKAQSNIFLQRSFWKSQPSIETINHKIKEGHDIAALNQNGFDAVVYALLEKVNNKTVIYLLSKEGNEVNKLTHDGRTYIFWAAYKSNLDMIKYLVEKGAKTDVIDDKGYSVFNFAASTGQLYEPLYDYLLTLGATPAKDTDHYGANAMLLAAPYMKDSKFIEYFSSKGLNINSTDNKGNDIINYAARSGNKALISYLVDQGVSYKSLNKEGGNAFIFASRGTRGKTNSLEFYQYLESLGINPNIVTKEGTTPLHAIASREKDQAILEYFINKGIDINQTNKDGNTAFLNAARSNNIDIVSFLYPKVKDINHQNKEGQSALSLAIGRNTPEVVAFLIKHKADIAVVDLKGRNLAYYLVNSFSTKNANVFKEKVKLLQNKGFNIQQPQKDGSTLYHLAVDKNNMMLLEWVNTLNVDINTKDSDGNTALHKAAMSSKSEDILKFLIKAGADLRAKTDFNESAYDLAKENELLKKNGVNIDFLK
jgi:ankyrin repeat protein